MALVRTGFIAIPPGKEPGVDHADVFRPGGRMYLANTGADRIDVLDCRQRTYLRSLPNVPGVAGVLIDEQRDLLFSSDRAAARVSVSRCSTEELIGRVDVGRSFDTGLLTAAETVETEPGAHTSCWDPESRSLYVFFPTSGGAAIDEDEI